MTQGQLAQAVGVALRTVGNWERGETVPMNRLARLEDVLHVTLRDASVTPGQQDAERNRLPVGTGVDPIDLAQLDPGDAEYVRGLYERLRRQRGD